VADQHDIFKQLQQQAAAHALQSHLLGMEEGVPQGLLVLGGGFDRDQLQQQVCRVLDAYSLRSPGLPAQLSFQAAGRRNLSRNIAELLEIEQARVAQTRLSCALLLLELDDSPAIEEIDMAMEHLIEVCQEKLDAVDILSVYERGKIVIILPGINRRQANIRAANILQTVASSPPLHAINPMTVSIAASLYRAGDAMNAEALLQRTAEELERRGKQKNCLLFLDKETDAGTGCQVSVEERTQLFSILD